MGVIDVPRTLAWVATDRSRLWSDRQRPRSQTDEAGDAEGGVPRRSGCRSGFAIVENALATAAFGYLVGLGALMLGLLLLTTEAVAGNHERVTALEFGDGRVLAGWTILATAALIPAAVLIVAFPGFYAG